MRKRQLAVIGGGLMQLPVLRIARKMGIETLCLDGNPEAPGKKEADHFVAADIQDQKKCLEAARQHQAVWGLDGVLTVGTDFSTTAAWIAQELKLPGHTYEATLKAKDKELMRQALQKAGLPSPYFQVFSANDLPSTLPFGRPCVVKPVDNMGARGVRLVRTDAEWLQAASEALGFSPTGRIVAEDYIEGPEYSLDALIQRGEFYPMGIADREIHFPPYFVELGHTFPCQADPARIKALWELLEAAARALGLTEGAVKGDLKWSSKGPMIGEIAARLSGGFMSGWTYPLSSGRSAIDAAIRIALGEKAAPAQENVLKPVVERAFFTIPGQLRAVKNLDQARELDGVKELFWLATPGKETRWPRNNVEKLGNVIVSTTQDKIAALVKTVRLLVKVELVSPHPRTESFFQSPQANWWFPEAKPWFDSRTQLPNFSSGFGHQWLDAYGITVKEWLDQYLQHNPQGLADLPSEAWQYFFQGGLTGLQYWRERSGGIKP